MWKKAQAPTFLLLVVTCTAMLVQSGLAQLPPGLIEPDAPQDVLQCWSSLGDIHGCIREIFSSVSSGRIGTVGPACCNAFLAIHENCWPKMFPIDPFFPPLLQKKCDADVAPGPITPGPTGPGPIAPGPVAPGPTEPEPIAPGPVAPGPIAPGPIAPGPIAPGPIAPGPTKPKPIVF